MENKLESIMEKLGRIEICRWKAGKNSYSVSNGSFRAVVRRNRLDYNDHYNCSLIIYEDDKRIFRESESSGKISEFYRNLTDKFKENKEKEQKIRARMCYN